MRHTVFVYGSLLRGMGNHRYLEGSNLWDKATLKGFKMYQVSSFPAIVTGEGSIQGEIYLVDDDTLARLDQLEGHPQMYERRLATAVLDTNGKLMPVWVYIWKRPIDRLTPVPSGDWREYRVEF